MTSVIITKINRKPMTLSKRLLPAQKQLSCLSVWLLWFAGFWSLCHLAPKKRSDVGENRIQSSHFGDEHILGMAGSIVWLLFIPWPVSRKGWNRLSRSYSSISKSALKHHAFEVEMDQRHIIPVKAWLIGHVVVLEQCKGPHSGGAGMQIFTGPRTLSGPRSWVGRSQR